MQDGFRLDDAFAGEDDVFGSKDGGTARDFVACFLTRDVLEGFLG